MLLYYPCVALACVALAGVALAGVLPVSCLTSCLRLASFRTWFATSFRTWRSVLGYPAWFLAQRGLWRGVQRRVWRVYGSVLGRYNQKCSVVENEYV